MFRGLFWSFFNFHQALLFFIYTDSIAEDVVESSSSSSSDSDVGDHFMAKLLAAADKYGLERLRLMCESHLCKNLSVRSVAQVLSFAEEHHATELKAVCLRFAAMNLGGTLLFNLVSMIFDKNVKRRNTIFFSSVNITCWFTKEPPLIELITKDM